MAGWFSLITPFGSSGMWTGVRSGLLASEVVASALATASTLDGDDSFGGGGGWFASCPGCCEAAGRFTRGGVGGFGGFARRIDPRGPGGILRVARVRTCRGNASDRRVPTTIFAIVIVFYGKSRVSVMINILGQLRSAFCCCRKEEDIASLVQRTLSCNLLSGMAEASKLFAATAHYYVIQASVITRRLKLKPNRTDRSKHSIVSISHD